MSVFPMPAQRCGPLITTARWRDTKDPCPVFDGSRWHIYGSAGSVLTESWEILHSSARSVRGPWALEEPARLIGVSSERTAAPGVVYEDYMFHMFVQTDFMSPGGALEHLVSEDGSIFNHVDTSIASEADTPEAGVFDAHPIRCGWERYLVYSAMSEDLQGLRWEPELYASKVRGPDIYLARSSTDTWDGPWDRLGVLLRQEDVPFHASLGNPEHEWGLEGPQLVALPNGQYLMVGVCFVGGRPRFQRQRLFFAVAAAVQGPYEVIAHPIEPRGTGWESGEIGHAAAVVAEGRLWLFYQARSQHPLPEDRGEAKWQFGSVCWAVNDIIAGLSP